MNDFEEIKRLCCASDYGIEYICQNFLINHGYFIIKTMDYIYAEGNIPLMLVAHMDTVLKRPPNPNLVFYDQKKQVMWSPEGLGVDDRAGIYAIMKLIEWCPQDLRPHILFTTGEEMGGIGAEIFAQDYSIPLKYIIELDRCGEDDCVFYDCDNLNFVSYVSSFGFVEEYGIFSDISIICPTWKVAGVNLSIGYDFEHSTREMLSIKILNKTIDKVKNMIQDIHNATYFEYIPTQYTTNYFIEECYLCHSIHFVSEMTLVQGDKSGAYIYVCPVCLQKKVKWCKHCGQGFVPDNDNVKCFICRKEPIIGYQTGNS